MKDMDNKPERPVAKRLREGTGRTRLDEVARRAGVSTATVSRTFSAPDKVSEAARAKVLAAAREVNWIPNAAGRALASSRTHIAGAIIPTLDAEIFARQVAGMQQVFSARGYELIIGCANYRPDEGLRQASTMLARGVEALALVGESHPTELFELMGAFHVPYVLTYTYHAEAAHPLVGFDNRAAFRQITDHMLALGHRRFGVILQSTENNDRAVARLAGIRDAIEAAGATLDPDNVAIGAPSLDFGRSAFDAFMDRRAGERPTAIVCGNDTLAHGALIAAARRDMRPPRDFSITGFDDLALSRHLTPSLTTMAVDNRRIGVIAAEELLAAIEGGVDRPCSVEIPPEFMNRESTGPVPTASKP